MDHPQKLWGNGARSALRVYSRVRQRTEKMMPHPAQRRDSGSAFGYFNNPYYICAILLTK